MITLDDKTVERSAVDAPDVATLRRLPIGALGVLALVTTISIVFVVAGFRPQDGDHHAQLADEVARWLRGQPGGVMVPEFVPWPNILGVLLLAVLSLVLGLELADAVLVALMPLGLSASLGAFWVRHGWSPMTAVAIAAPFSVGATFGMGFYNFQVSIILAFGFAALLTPGQDGAPRLEGRRRRVILALGLILTWLAHILGFCALVGYLLLNGGPRAAALRQRLRILWPVFLAIGWWVLASPKGTVQAGEFDLVQRIVAIGSWDAFITLYNNTERLFTVVLAAMVYLVAVDRCWVTVDLKQRIRRPRSMGLAVLAVGAAVAGILVPPSVLNGAYLWHRAGMVAVIFAIAWIGETLEPLGPRANKLLAALGVAVFVGLSVARIGPVTTIADQRAEIRSLEAFIARDDIVAAVSGPSGETYTRAYPLAHVAGRMAAETDSDFLSNIFPASGQSPMAYPDGTQFVWDLVPDESFDAQPLAPTVFIAIGDLDPVTVKRMQDEGFRVVTTTPSGIAALWRR